jgi:hypothetical protein
VLHAAACCHAVVSSKFCLPQQVTLVMQESLGAYMNDDFHICNASGKPCLRDTDLSVNISTFSAIHRPALSPASVAQKFNPCPAGASHNITHSTAGPASQQEPPFAI